MTRQRKPPTTLRQDAGDWGQQRHEILVHQPVGISAPAVRERVARLQEAGVKSAYRLEVDPARDRTPARGLGPHQAWPRPTPQDR